MSLKLEYFAGTTLTDPDPKNLGRYKVHIPELQLRMSKTTGLWCRNRVQSYKLTNSESGVYGNYTPIQPGTHVTVEIANDDYSSAAISRINVPESALGRDTLPFNTTDDCRDDIYLVLRTARYDTLIAVTEDLPPKDTNTIRTEPSNSLFMYHNNGDTKIILNSDGIHIHTIHNLSATVDGNSSIIVNGSSGIHVGGNCDLTVGGVTNVTGGGDINVDAPNINLNSGAAAPGQIAGYDTFPPIDKELKFRSADQNL